MWTCLFFRYSFHTAYHTSECEFIQRRSFSFSLSVLCATWLWNLGFFCVPNYVSSLSDEETATSFCFFLFCFRFLFILVVCFINPKQAGQPRKMVKRDLDPWKRFCQVSGSNRQKARKEFKFGASVTEHVRKQIRDHLVSTFIYFSWCELYTFSSSRLYLSQLTLRPNKDRYTDYTEYISFHLFISWGIWCLWMLENCYNS